MHCSQCGNPTQPNSAYCPHCGHRLDRPPSAERGAVDSGSSTVGSGEAAGAGSDDESLALPPGAALFGAGEKSPPETQATKAADGQTLWEGRFDCRGMIGRVLLSALVTLGLIMLSISWSWLRGQWLVVLGMVVLLWVYQYLVYVARHYGHRYRLTGQTLVHDSGILVRSSSPIEIIAIDDISYRQTIFERVLGVGTIRIVSADRSDPVLELHGIRDVAAAFSTIDQARRAERRRRAVRVDNV